ncbi:MAG TPA: PAS domain-containing protein [Chryseosolibacter sp.]
MSDTLSTPTFSFLDTSEVGSHLKKKDWSTHDLGPMTSWDPVLLNTLNIVLESGFPHFLYWGDDNICFYNDAFKTSFGSEEYQLSGIGQPLAKVFPEQVDAISSLVATVKATGKKQFFRDTPTQINRSGKLIDTTWTFSYSPVKNLEGEVLGVLSVCLETTDNVKAYDLAIASEQRFRETFMKAPIGLLIIKGQNNIIDFANEMYLKLIDKDSTCIGKNLWDVIPEVVDQGFDKLVNQVYETGVPIRSAEHEVKLRRNGQLETGYYTFSYEPIREADGTVGGVMAIVVDVTENVIARHKIELAEERLRQAVEATQIGTYDLNLITEEIHASERFYQIFGFVYDAGHSLLVDTLHPEDKKIREAAHRKAYATGHLSYEARIIWKSGKIRWIRIVGNIVYDKDRTPLRIMGSVLDITDEKETRAELAATAETLELALKAGKIGSFELDLATEKINCTEQCKANFGLQSDDSFNVQKFFGLVLPEDRQAVKAALENTVKNRVPYEADYRVKWSDGTIHKIHAAGLPVCDKKGQVIKITGVTVVASHRGM